MSSRNCPECGADLEQDAVNQPCPACLMKLGLASWANLQSDSASRSPTMMENTHFSTPSIEELTARLPNLEVLELLGQGGMGAVYKARQISLDRIVAMKLIRPDAAADTGFAERFVREARALARLNHPNIVTIHDFGEADGLFYLVMEHVDGTNLGELIETRTLQPRQALEIIPAICEALQYAHDASIVHRDIKPANILISTSGHVKIVDFGLARLTGGDQASVTLTGTRQVMGTPRYMAPEQMTGSHTVDHRADIYSLGVVFYEMLTGEVPMGQFEPPSRKANVDGRIDEVVMRALAREPERRYQTASELRTRVQAISSSAVTPDSRNQTPGGGKQRSGMSTILEREAFAVWHWVAGESDATAAAGRPELPVLLLVLLCIAGCLTVLLPWANVEVRKPAESKARDYRGLASDSPSVALETNNDLEEGHGEYLLCQAKAGWLPFVSEMDPDAINLPVAGRYVLSGYQVWPGVVVSVIFGLMALLLIALPPPQRRLIRWSLLMLVLSSVALLHTLLFGVAAASAQARPFATLSAGLSSNPSATVTGDQHRIDQPFLTVFQEQAEAESASTYDAARMYQELTYSYGFYGAFGLSVTMLLFSAIGIRHGVANRTASWDRVSSPGKARAEGQPAASDSPRKIREEMESIEFDEVTAQVATPAFVLLTVAVLGVAASAGTLVTWANMEPYTFSELWFLPFGYGMLGLVIAVAAWNMYRLRSLGLAMTGGILALLPMSPAWFLTLPLGIWAIRVLNRTDVRRAFIVCARQRQQQRQLLASHAQTAYSRKAVVGACGIPLWIITGSLALSMALLTARGSETGSSDRFASAALMLVYCGVPTILFGSLTTILGFLALVDIRQSGGHLSGLGLAFVDSVFFPLVLLNGAAIGAITAFLVGASCPIEELLSIVLTIVVLLIVVSGFAVRFLWRLANEH